jgi:hypothetical protein
VPQNTTRHIKTSSTNARLDQCWRSKHESCVDTTHYKAQSTRVVRRHYSLQGAVHTSRASTLLTTRCSQHESCVDTTHYKVQSTRVVRRHYSLQGAVNTSRASTLLTTRCSQHESCVDTTHYKAQSTRFVRRHYSLQGAVNTIRGRPQVRDCAGRTRLQRVNTTGVPAAAQTGAFLTSMACGSVSAPSPACRRHSAGMRSEARAKACESRPTGTGAKVSTEYTFCGRLATCCVMMMMMISLFGPLSNRGSRGLSQRFARTIGKQHIRNLEDL